MVIYARYKWMIEDLFHVIFSLPKSTYGEGWPYNRPYTKEEVPFFYKYVG